MEMEIEVKWCRRSKPAREIKEFFLNFFSSELPTYIYFLMTNGREYARLLISQKNSQKDLRSLSLLWGKQMEL